MSGVDELCDEAAALGYPALGLTDHGTVAGLVQHYRGCRRNGMEPLPGVELYVAADRERKVQGHNLHLTVNAYTTQGYRNLCKLITRTAVNYYYKPIVDFADLAEMAEEGLTQGLSVATGCWFGVLPTIIRTQGEAAGVAMAKTLAGWFPRVYIEMQNHGIAIEDQRGDVAWSVPNIWGAPEEPSLLFLGEDDMVAALYRVSQEASLPFIVTTDAHYTYASEQDLHDSFKLLCSFSDEPDDAIFPGDPYCLRSGEDMKTYFDPDILEDACEALAELAEAAYVRIPELEKFKMLVPDVTFGGNPDEELRVAALQGFEELMPAGMSKGRRDKALQRMNHELDVVETTKMASYLLLVRKVCVFMREENIVYIVRGSANDFFLNYLLKITLVDAMAWDLRPERFMSADRTKPPDIDLDVEHARRELVAAWLSERFNTCKVGTIMKYKLSAFGEDEAEVGKGSLRVRYFATMKKQNRGIENWIDVPHEHQQTLYRLADKRLISGYGTHPAGLIIAPDAALISQLPMVRLGTKESSHLITAYDKNDVEDMGFIKLDLLGSRTMTAVRTACDLIEPGTPAVDYLANIPLNDGKVFRRISSGRVASTFQLQEDAARRFVTLMKPRNINDLVAAMALVRPAARSAGITDAYLDRRNKVEIPPVMHADLAAETEKTFGLLLYQEQVIGCLRTLRMDMAELNTLLKAVKASNDYVAGAKLAIAQAMPRIRSLAEVRGWTEADIKLLVDAISGYADYGFNEAHAVAYGLLTYHTAWLAEYYPVQWWTGVLDAYTGDKKKEDRYVMAARRNGVNIAGPHVNHSGLGYRFDPMLNMVRKGLLSVAGVGPVAAQELADNAPYASLEDLGKRCLPKRVSGAMALALHKPREDWTGVIEKLDAQGALVGLE